MRSRAAPGHLHGEMFSIGDTKLVDRLAAAAGASQGMTSGGQIRRCASVVACVMITVRPQDPGEGRLSDL
jgi:hypothetical protein